MSEATSSDHRRAIAERNVAAILDAAESLLARGTAATTTAVARAAGLSRVTVYAHFATREELVAAVVARVVRRAGEAFAAAELDRGGALEALDRLIAAAWGEIERNNAIAGAAMEDLSAPALARAHEALRGPIGALVARGRAEGAFRDDLPADWLLSTYFALMHAAGDDVRGGRLDAADATPILQATIRDVFTGAARR